MVFVAEKIWVYVFHLKARREFIATVSDFSRLKVEEPYGYSIVYSIGVIRQHEFVLEPNDEKNVEWIVSVWVYLGVHTLHILLTLTEKVWPYPVNLFSDLFVR